jgi:hypothetical protein
MSTNVATTSEDPQTNPVLASNGKDDITDIIVIPKQTWQDPGYSAWHHAKIGLLLGCLGGCTSLILNVIGSATWPAISGQLQHPLRLIQVYLTFPLGEYALTLDGGVALALGCILYLVTGMLYGVLFTAVMSYFVPNANVWARLIFCSILALLVWVANFYLLLTWLQPVVVGNGWIADLIPWWVAALTHLIYGWTVAVLYPLGTSRSTAPRLPIRW